MVFGKQSLQGYESNRRHAGGVRVENIPRNRNVGPPREDSQMTGLQCEPEHFKDRIIFLSMFNDIQWEQKEIQKDVKTIHRQLLIVLANSLAVIGLSWGVDQKRSGAEPTLTQTRWIMGSNGTRNDGQFLSIRSSDISCLQCFCERRITMQSRRKEVFSLQW